MTLDLTVPADAVEGDDHDTLRPPRRRWRARSPRFRPTNPHPGDGRWGSALRMLRARAQREAESRGGAKEGDT